MTLITGARAECIGVVAGAPGPLQLADAVVEGAVSITFLGHASFLIESRRGKDRDRLQRRDPGPGNA
ncbi:MAG: hypothetical protein JO320_18205 [Alphaproteobacteria bacterium]|nr:hypothetical protein [Alphaproteobacteria bacterium]